MMRRRLIAAIALTAAGLLGGCRPDLGTPQSLVVGPRVSTGFFTQLQSRSDFAGQIVLDIVMTQRGELQAAMAALARYGLVEAARRPYDVLSGGEKARLEVLTLELEGHNLLLLDEPTDNLDLASAEALEEGLRAFDGTVSIAAAPCCRAGANAVVRTLTTLTGSVICTVAVALPA